MGLRHRHKIAVYLSDEERELLESMAESHGLSITAVMRRGLSLLQIHERAVKAGMAHGYAHDPSGLDVLVPD